MQLQWVVLRILHVGLGAFWVGTDVFFTLLLVPRLRALGSDVERVVMGTLMRCLPPVLIAASLVTAITGVWMAVTMQGWGLGWLVASRWGVAMLVGGAGTLVALFVGLGLIPPVTIRYDRLRRTIEGRPPTPEERRALDRLARRATTLAHVNTALLIVVVIAMAVARYI